jgi:hypothetical protein
MQTVRIKPVLKYESVRTLSPRNINLKTMLSQCLKVKEFKKTHTKILLFVHKILEMRKKQLTSKSLSKQSEV